MTPYKDPERQREFQRDWQFGRRAAWIARQQCELCGYRGGLRLFRHMGAPKVTWRLDGPSHRRFRVVCGDPSACLRRRAHGYTPPPKPKALTTQQRRKLRVLRGGKLSKRKTRAKKKKAAAPPKPRPRKKPIVEAPPAVKQTKLARQIAEPDPRPTCPKHGPRNTTIVRDVVRFVCCGRPVPGAPPPPKAHRWA